MFAEGSALWKLWCYLSRECSHCRACFSTPDGKAVLAALAPFCFANASCRTEREAGRREVWLWLQQRLNLDPEELTVLFAKLGPEHRHQLFTGPSATYLEE